MSSRSGPTSSLSLFTSLFDFMQTEVGLFDLGATEVRCLTRGPDLISVLCPFDGSDMWCRLAFSNGEVCIGEKFKTSVADHLQTTFASPSWGLMVCSYQAAPASYVDGYRAIPKSWRRPSPGQVSQ